jgi:hypothetical protein
MGSKTFAFGFRVPQKELKALGLEPTEYDSDDHFAYFHIKPDTTKTRDHMPFFEYCYRKLAGAQSS